MVVLHLLFYSLWQPNAMTGDIKIFNEDWMTALVQIETGSVQCCVTSPPYWGLRDYGMEGQLGLEKTPEEYIRKLVEGFSLLRNALAENGVLWLNLGDSYVSGKGRYSSIEQTISGKNRGEPIEDNIPDLRNHEYLKDKDLAMIPARVAIALQRDGWWLRSEIVWNKPNPMPESVKDRPTKSHEMIYLLTKNARYYYDAEAIYEPANYDGRKDTIFKGSLKYDQDTLHRVGGERWPKKMKNLEPHGQQPNTMHKRRAQGLPDIKYPARNKRDVWSINTECYREMHFATFPEEIPRLCIAAGSKEGQIILDPFAGSGTTGDVALRMKRRFIGIELNSTYVNTLIEPRLNNIDPLFRGNAQNRFKEE